MSVLLVLLLALGSACLFFANLVQRTALRMMDQPRNRLADWSSKVASSRGGVCGDPGDARVSVEDLSAPDDLDDDSPAEAQAPAGSLRKGFRLDSGDCDAFHFFFNGKGVTWWRR